jgi:hypothetical protein
MAALASEEFVDMMGWDEVHEGTENAERGNRMGEGLGKRALTSEVKLHLR